MFLTQFPLQSFVKISILKVVFVVNGLKLGDGFVWSVNCLFNSRPGWFWAVWGYGGRTRPLVVVKFTTLNANMAKFGSI